MNLQIKSEQIRQKVFRVALENNCSHIAPSLSCIEILVTLYYSVLKPDDKFILSKAHGCYGLYAILADKGIIERDKWERFDLPGCSEKMKGIIAGCGSLGHGLPIATGIAFSKKLRNKKGRVFCLMGDGECQEGTTWESLQFALYHELENLTIIIDANRLQAMDSIKNIMDTSNYSLYERFNGFGLNTRYIDGHSVKALRQALKHKDINRPLVIFADTIKGHTIPCMENIPKFHFRQPACLM